MQSCEADIVTYSIDYPTHHIPRNACNVYDSMMCFAIIVISHAKMQITLVVVDRIGKLPPNNAI